MSGAWGFGESTPVRQRKENLTSWDPSEPPEGEAGVRWRQWFRKVAFAQSVKPLSFTSLALAVRL